MNETPSCSYAVASACLLRSGRTRRRGRPRRAHSIGSRRQPRNRCPCVIICLRHQSGPSDVPRGSSVAVAVCRCRCRRAVGGGARRPSRQRRRPRADGAAMLATIQALTAPGHGRPRRPARRATPRRGPGFVERFTRTRPDAGATGSLRSAVLVHAARPARPTHGVNLVGAVPGPSPDLPVLVVSAHYDHLGDPRRPDLSRRRRQRLGRRDAAGRRRALRGRALRPHAGPRCLRRRGAGAARRARPSSPRRRCQGAGSR